MIGKIIDSYKRWQRRRSLRGRRGPDFARGDHAVCVQEGPWIYFETGDISDNGPAVGECRVVVDIGMKYDSQLIKLAGLPDSWFTADSFRKLLFDKREAHNECPELIKRLKHIKELEDA